MNLRQLLALRDRALRDALIVSLCRSPEGSGITPEEAASLIDRVFEQASRDWEETSLRILTGSKRKVGAWLRTKLE